LRGGAFGSNEREGRFEEGLMEDVKGSDNLEDVDIDDT
jgi:hypothetical protein